MKQLPIEALAEYAYLSSLSMSPSGSYGVYAVHKANLNENQYVSDLWYFTSKDGHTAPSRLTSSGKVSSFEWFPTGDHLFYPSSKDASVKKSQDEGEPLTVYYRLGLTGGESVEWMRIPLRVSQIKALSDDYYLVSAQWHPEYDRFNAAPKEERPSILKAWKEENDYEVIEEIPYWVNGGSFLRGVRNRLFIFNRQTSALSPLTGPDTQVQGWHYEADWQRLVVIAKTYRGKAPLKSQLLISNLTLDQLVAGQMPALQGVTPPDTHAIHYAYSLQEGQMVVLANPGDRHGLNQNAQFYTLSLSNPSTLEPFAPHFTGTVGNTVGSDARYGSRRGLQSINGVLYFVSTEGESAYLNRLLPNGQIDRLTPTPGSVDDFYVVAEDRIYLSAMRGNQLAEVYQLFNGVEVPISDHNAWVYKTYGLSTPQAISIPRGENAVGEPVTVDGWLMAPVVSHDQASANDRAGHAILNIHGGPKTVYGPIFYHEMQYWANQGYHVMFCNPRGSDGKGNHFSDIRGKYGTIDYEDIMAFVDSVLADNPQIDPEHLYVTGGSYGGFMTNWIVGHTNRFKAAASQRSISNWVTEYGVTDIGYYFVPDQMGATPWSDYEALWEMSPLKHAPAIETPLLLIHSDQDYRCWIPEALQLFTALKDMGKETRLCVFKGENHELSRSGKPKHRIRRIQEITNWWLSHS